MEECWAFRKSRTFVIREVVLHWWDGELLSEPINLVQEQDDGSLDEPSGVADRVKQRKSFLHTIDSLIFKQKLIVLGNGNKEENRCHVLKTMDPLLSFWSLTTDIEHPIRQVANDKRRLGDTSRLDTRSEDILIIWKIVWLRNAIERIKVTTVGKQKWRTKNITGSTYYLAESLSWYSRDLLKHSITPRSCHKALIAFPTSGGRLSPSICCGCIKIVWTWYSWRWSSKGNSNDSIASKITLIDWTVFEKIISLNDSRSSLLYPPSWINFICFKMVDFPDSPAPERWKPR